MQISEMIMGNEIELDVLEQLTLNLTNFLNCLRITLMVERCEIETRPFRKETVRTSKRWIVDGEQGFQFFAALLQPPQLISKLIPATVIAQKIGPASFAFKHGDRRGPPASVDLDSSHINAKR